MSLSDWEKNRWLVAHKTSRKEVAALLELVRRDLSGSALKNLDPDWQLNIAYNAALQIAKIGLAASGYRPGKGSGSHHHTVHSLSLTLGTSAEIIERLDWFGKRRNISEYERAGVTSPDEAKEMRELASELHTMVLSWLATNHKELLS